MSVFTPDDAAAVTGALDALKAEVDEATVLSEAVAEAVGPTPFTPASSSLDDAIANFVPTPYSDAEIQTVQEKVLEAAQSESRGAQISQKALYVIEQLVSFVPVLFGVPKV